MQGRWIAIAVTTTLGVSIAGAAERAFVLNSAARSVSIIDTATDTVTGTVDLGGARPEAAVAHPDGTRVYVAAGANVFTIDPAAATITDSFQPYYYGVSAVGMNPSGSRLYVTIEGAVRAFDAVTHVQQYAWGTGYPGPRFLVPAPDGTRLYLLSMGGSNVALRFFDTRTRLVTASLPVPDAVSAVVSPDGATVYVASPGALFAVDTATASITNQQPLPSLGLVALAPDGNTLFVPRSGALLAVDPTTLLQTGQGTLSNDPTGIAVHPAGGRVYVSDAGLGSVGVFDAGTLAQTGSIPVGYGPRGIVIGGCAGGAGDCDADGAADGTDNCPHTANAGQSDGDGDGLGDACDVCPAAADPGQADGDFNDVGDACQDVDGDGVIDSADNCVTTANPGQDNADGDNHGDACDVCPGSNDAADADSDARADGCDNCPLAYNPGQADGNANLVGDACEDRDGDTLLDADDNCPDTSNPGQEDDDRDWLGDACDACLDHDRDGFGDSGTPGNLCPDDNCPGVENPDQTDANGDLIGDRCAICAVMGDAAAFPMLAVDTMKWKTGAAYYNRYPTEIANESDVCATKVIGRGGTIEYDVVATEPFKRAASILDTQGYYSEDASVSSVITGGGDAQVSPYTAYEFVDTTGTHPDVQVCLDAKAAAQAASAYFASLPATQTYGDLIVPSGNVWPEATISVSGTEVINVQRLIVSGKVGQWGCRNYATLLIDSATYDPNDTVIINVFDQFRMGDCGNIENYVGDLEQVIINVVGPGKAVKFGQGSDTPVGVLAPERAIKVQGAQNFEEPTWVEGLWAKKLKMIGYLCANTAEYDYNNGNSYCGIDAEYAEPLP